MFMDGFIMNLDIFRIFSTHKNGASSNRPMKPQELDLMSLQQQARKWRMAEGKDKEWSARLMLGI